MCYEDIYVTGLGVRLGDQVRASAMVRRGVLAVADVRRTRQRSVCVAPEGSGGSGPELAVAAAREAVRGHEEVTGSRPAIGAHLHAQMFDKPDFWSAACYVLGRLGVTGCGVVCDMGAMSNGAVMGVDLAASLLGARPDLHTALITTGDRFAGDGFARYRSDHGVLFGDAGAALVLSRIRGFARVLSTASCTDPVLEGLTRGTPPTTTTTTTIRTIRTTGSTPASSSIATAVGGGVIDVRARQRAWFRDHGGLAEALRRNWVGVTTATCVALADAGITLDEARWVVLPFLGYEAMRARWFRPLGIDADLEDRTLTLLGLHLGHLGAADHIVGLRHLMATDALDAGDYVVLASAGAGMTWTTAVIQLLDTSEDPRDDEDMPSKSVSARRWSTQGTSLAGELIAA